MDISLHEFSAYLNNLGYSEKTQNRIVKATQEFLFKMKEQKIRSLKEIKPEHIQEHYEYLQQRPNERRAGGLSSGMINGYMEGLKIYFTYLQKIEAIYENPISLLTFAPTEYNPREILTEQEVKELYEATETFKDKAILAIFYGCGLRRTEGEKLTIKDVQWKTLLLFVREGKGKKRRVIPMTPKVAEDLKNYYFHERNQNIKRKDLFREEAFILNSYGRRMTGQLFDRRLKYLLQKTTIRKEISLHCLRHSIATHLLERGLKLEYVKDFLGHDYFESTEIYTRVNKNLLKRL